MKAFALRCYRSSLIVMDVDKHFDSVVCGFVVYSSSLDCTGAYLTFDANDPEITIVCEESLDNLLANNVELFL